MSKKEQRYKETFRAILKCFVSWDNCFIGTGSLLNILIPEYPSGKLTNETEDNASPDYS
jgi:hypothetical protein